MAGSRRTRVQGAEAVIKPSAMRIRFIGVSALVLVGACSNAAAPAAAPAVESAAPSAAPAPVVTTPSASASVAAPADPALARAEAIVEATDRDADDKKLDAGRHPAELLAFFDVQPGMKVAELGAGGGYTSELLARAVGPTGTVYGQNSPMILERFAEKPWSLRLSKPVMKNVVRSDRAFDDPLPKEAHDLDRVLIVLFYHDTVWQKVDRDKMNHAVFAALKSGGIYGIVDHSAKDGSGLSDVETLHRIDEKTLKDEVTHAGFVLSGEGDFLRSASDTRDWSASPRTAGERRGTSDRFVLSFKKP
jgi:predicted methyltransferase